MLTTNQMWEKAEKIMKATEAYKEPGFEKFKTPFNKELKGHLEEEKGVVICMLMVLCDPKNEPLIRKVKEKIKLKALEILDRSNSHIELVRTDESQDASA